MTGRGFAVAASDAETLAEELAKHPAGTGITALHAYEQRRLGPARDVVTSSGQCIQPVLQAQHLASEMDA